jgi:class 3 adenylate cyclase/ketosteroid isomerase-like protein
VETQANIPCPSCRHGNRPGRRFCAECGARLTTTCASCGTTNEPGEKFCGACGVPLLSSRPDPDTGARKVVTIVFADLIGSTSLHERLDAESARALMDRYYRALHAVVDTHGGRVVKLLGDGVMAAFGLPRVAEDDAIRAVRAAVAMQQAFRTLAREQSTAVGTIGLRVAVNTGEVVVNAAHDDVVGDPINVAARLQDAAHDGDVVIGEATRRLVGGVVTLAPLGRVALRGRAETVAAHRVVSLERPGSASAVAFVGREEELARLTAVYDAARAGPAARLAVVLGSPGVGKSRLLDEFTGRLDGATVLVAHCEAAGGATFAPIAKALRAVLGVGAGTGGYDLRAAIDAAVPGSDADRSRIAAGIGALLAGTPASPEETFFVVRRLLTGLSAAQPVVLVLDDVQWAEPLLLDLLEHLVQWSTGVPLLLLAAARPDLREARSALVAPGRLASDVVMLGGLDAAAATRLAANVLGADALPATVAGRVLATSEGNPLFLGELVRMLVDDGTLKREGDRWTTGTDLATVDMPPTIHALLAARIERLRAEDRMVLERAAIVGRQFSRSAVAQLLPSETRSDLDARMEALRRSELVEPDPGWFLGEPALRFHHGLIRDAAYRRVLKGTRAELHGRVADWIESRVEGAVEHDETIGWHLEQAHRHLCELGPIDDRGRTLGDRAARYLAAAGRRALGRDDLPLAASLLGRALERLDAADPARADLALDWCEALLSAGDVGPAAKALDELGRFTGDANRLRAWHTCYAGQLAVLTDPQTLRATVDAVAAAAVKLAEVGDGAGEAKAHSVHAGALARLGKVGACEAALDKALAAARRAHDRRRANTVLANAPLAALWGPSPVTRASGRCLDVVRVLRITQGAPAVEAVALRCQAVLEALRGRTDAARRMIASSRHMVEELGITQELLEVDVFAGLIDLLEGDAVAAERSLRGAYDGLRDHGLAIDAARAAGFLGRALLAQGRANEAEALSHDSEALAGDDLQAAITWRGVRAEALAMRGEHAAGVDFARAAVEIAAATDALLHHANARLALTRALRAAGRRDEADAEEARAIELWGAKGATLLAERARRVAPTIRESDRTPDRRVAGARATRRRLRTNAATASQSHLHTAVAARDVDALARFLAEDLEVVHHPTGTTYDRRGSLAHWRSALQAQDQDQDFTCASEPLATLGDSLALCRLSIAGTRVGGAKFDFGAYELVDISLIEVDAQGRQRLVEKFVTDRLGDAIVRLYKRYAELLPDGPKRIHAAAVARSIAVVLNTADVDAVGPILAPGLEFIDHRTLGFASTRRAESFLRGLRSLDELTADRALRVDDVLGLRSDAILALRTHSGTDRVSGGTYERHHLALWAFGPDGRVTRLEHFDPDRADDGLARFEELTARATTLTPAAGARGAATPERRVRPNSATANMARLEAAIAARDFDAVAAHVTDGSKITDHTSGIVYDREGNLSVWSAVMRAQGGTMRQEPLATLGDSLALARQWISASGVARGKFDVGAYEGENIILAEVDAGGQRRRATEIFAADRLSDAVVRLYERYADLLPDGPARASAVATAGSVAAMAGPSHVERWAKFAPSIEFVDRRTVGFGSVHGAEAVRESMRALLELVEDWTQRFDDILALRPDALLVRWTNSGTQRSGGGAYERRLVLLFVVGPDGRVTYIEQFDVDRDDEALARFDESAREAARARSTVTPSSVATRRTRRVRPNAATANAARIDAAIAARDADAIAPILADEMETIDHTTGATFGRQGSLIGWQGLLRAQDGRCQHEPLATLGDSLALCRQWLAGSGRAGKTFDVGAFEIEAIILIEVDAQGRRRGIEIFAPDRLVDAVARLYERYAEILPDSPARVRAAATARTVALGRLPFDPDRHAAAFAPAIEAVDHRVLGTFSARGAEAVLRNFRSFRDVADDIGGHGYDVLALEPNAILSRWTHTGTVRASGGDYERPYLELRVFGSDGLQSRLEFFDVDREDDALGRFDELTGETPPRRLAAAPPRAAEQRARRVRPNAATANAASQEAAIAARDVDGLKSLLAEDMGVVDHRSDSEHGREGVLFSYRSLLEAEDLRFRNEPLATVGDALALCRWSASASRSTVWNFDVGAHEREFLALIEVDAHGRRGRTEIFAPTRLTDAVVRLYERYAELLPDGPESERAATTARSVACQLGPLDLDRMVSGMASDIGLRDHRTVGVGSVRGAARIRDALGRLFDLGNDLANRADAVLDLCPNATLLLITNSGTDHLGGGTFERPFLMAWVFGADGRIARIEQFDVGHEAEALARFDALTGGASGTRSLAAPSQAATTRERRVRPNAATANAARTEAIVAAGDVDELDGLLADDFETLDHIAGREWRREGALFSLRSLLGADGLRLRIEPLAMLGDALALCRWSVSASGLTTRDFDVGAYESESVHLIEVDAQGRRRRLEVFAVGCVSDAVVRLYERYAEILPDGAARVRAAATARSVAALAGPFDPDRWVTAFSPAIEVADRRSLGTWSAHGTEAFLEHFRGLGEVASDIVMRADLVDLRPDALLVLRTHVGTDRIGGGAYERVHLSLAVFGPDGLVARNELFDSDCEAEALVRFDELAVEPAVLPLRRRVRANAATAHAARTEATIAARDVDGLGSLLADDMETLDHNAGSEWGREGVLFSLRSLLRAEDLKLRIEPLATLGDALALCRWSVSASGLTTRDFDVGAYETESLNLFEVDARGRRRRNEIFATARLGDAVARLYECYAELLPAGAARTRAAATARSITAIVTLDANRPPFAHDMECVDHRALGLWSARGAAAALRRMRALFELADDVTVRVHDVVGASPDAILWRSTFSGTDRASGGAFEQHALQLRVFGADGLQTRLEFFDADATDDALARFDELTAERPATRRIENAATRALVRFAEAWEARDWERIATMYPPEFHLSDRRTMMHMELDREQHLASLRTIFEMTSGRFSTELLASRGDRLALFRQRFEGSDRATGPLEVEFLAVGETNDRGERTAIVMIDPDDLDAAYDELDARFAAGEAARHPTMEVGPRFTRAVAARDWEKLASLYAPDFILDDHRLLGWGTLRSGDEVVARVRALVDLRPDVVVRMNHVLALDDRGALAVVVWEGSQAEGAFEIPAIVVSQVAPMPDGRFERYHVYDLDQLEEARAMYRELRTESPAHIDSPRTGTPSGPLAAPARPNAPTAAREPRPDRLRIPPNAAMHANERRSRAMETRDWAAYEALCSPTLEFDDRRKAALTTGGRDMLMASVRLIGEARARKERTVLATAGDRLALEHVRWVGAEDRVPFEAEALSLTEVDTEGRIIAVVSFDPDDRRAANLELVDRLARGSGRDVSALLEWRRGMLSGDLERIRAALPDDFVYHDHRRSGPGRLETLDAYVAWVGSLFRQSPDAINEHMYEVAAGRHAMVSVSHAFGTLPEGGAFESVFVNLIHLERGRPVGVEVFELENLDVARARFEELRPEAPS